MLVVGRTSRYWDVETCGQARDNTLEELTCGMKSSFLFEKLGNVHGMLHFWHVCYYIAPAFKLVSNCKKNTENESILNVTFNFLHNSHYSRTFST